MNAPTPSSAPTALTVGINRTHVLDHQGPAASPAMVCLHGFGGSAHNWDLLAPLLAVRRRVLAPDLLGHGLTPASPDPTTGAVLDQIADVIHELTPSTPTRRVILVGSSFGGTMALQFAARYRELVSGVVVLAAPTPQRPDRSRDPVMTLKRWLVSAPGISGAIYRRTSNRSPDEVVAEQLRSAGIDPAELDPGIWDDAVALQARRHHDRASHDAQQHLLRSLLRMLEQGRRFASSTASVTVPVLWLQGEEDPLVPERQARAFVRRHSTWTYASRAGTGHVPALTDPAWVADAVDTWLGELTMTAQPPTSSATTAKD